MATTLTRGTTTIDVSTLATGTYSVRVQQNNALYNTRLEVVQQ
jgi:multisubunit Na+/H+ antiporter MnhE subunit